MQLSPKAVAGFLLCTVVCFSARPSQAQTRASSLVPSSVRRVQILQNEALHKRGLIEIEIEASDRLIPQTQLLTSPDRLVVDFANTRPGAQLRNQMVNGGEVTSVRVGLFSAKPPVTRIVFDLNGPQHYQVFPDGRTVMVKVGGTASTEAAGVNPASASGSGQASLHPSENLAGHSSGHSSGRSSGLGLVNATYPAHAVRITPPVPPPAKPPLEVTFHNGLLSISSNKASLSEILFAVHQRTGAEIAIPAGAEQEQVMGDLGPAPAPEVLAHLLNGSKFNFLILSSTTNPGALDRVILSPRSEALAPLPLPPGAMPQVQARAEAEEEAEPEIPPSSAAPQPGNPNPPQPPPTPPDARAPQGNDVPD